MRKNTRNNYIIAGIIVAVILIGILAKTGNLGFLPFAVGGGEIVKYAIPHNGAYSCQAIDAGNPTYDIGIDGLYISKKSIGVYTDQVTGINVYIPKTFWDSFFRIISTGKVRAVYGYCDQYEKNCLLEYKQLTYSGSTTLPLKTTSLNPQTESFFVAIQTRKSVFSDWKNDGSLGATLNYAYTKYGLVYISTTGNPAGDLFKGCESSCDLTCPEQKSRDEQGLIYTTQNSLFPRGSVQVLEYWEELNIDLNKEFGATIYDGDIFCFGGAIYEKGIVKLDNGNTYIYPKTATRDNVECCKGAVISTSTEDKICQDDYTWKTITKETRIKCVSDFNCPGQGQFTCQNKVKSGYSCGSDGYCNKDLTSIQVECCSQADCPTDQTCQNYNCVGGAITPPIIVYNQTNQTGDGLQCSFYQTEKLSIEKDYGFAYWRALINKPKITETPYCGESTWFLVLEILSVIVVLGLMINLILSKVYPKKGKRKRR